MRKVLPLPGVFALCALISFGMGCLVKSDRFVAGTYHAESPCAIITLVVKRDHSFVQSVHTNAGGANQLSGSWARDEKGWITFRPFLDFLKDEHGQQLEAAVYRPELLPRGIVLGPFVIKCPESDHEINYVK